MLVDLRKHVAAAIFDCHIAIVLLPAPAFQREARSPNSAFTFKLQRNSRRGLTLQRRICNDLREELLPPRSKRQLCHAYRRLRRFVTRTVCERIVHARFARGLARVHVRVHQ